MYEDQSFANSLLKFFRGSSKATNEDRLYLKTIGKPHNIMTLDICKIE